MDGYQPSRQADVDLHFLHIRSPAQALGKASLHIRQLLVMVSGPLSASGLGVSGTASIRNPHNLIRAKKPGPNIWWPSARIY